MLVRIRDPLIYKVQVDCEFVSIYNLNKNKKVKFGSTLRGVVQVRLYKRTFRKVYKIRKFEFL